MKTHVSGKSDQVERLVVLPFKKALEISLKSLQARFYRSLITTFSLLLAVAFLSFVSVRPMWPTACWPRGIRPCARH